MKELITHISQEHFEGDKEKLVYLINNYDYAYTLMKNLHLEKGV